MDIRVTHDQADDCKVYPLRGVFIERVERNQEGKHPQLEHNRGSNTTVDKFAIKGHKNKEHDPEGKRRYRQKVCLYCREAKITERERKVGLRWSNRHCG